ncbi:MAG TPA: glycosyltransferase family 9 protein [Cyclobacteriaceae bacterium]|nr:glycosyltransferase family 9 protein [Cyclobacteriaceae bacterium]
MKILVLRFSSIGDIVLTTPVVRTIKSQIDQVELHYATKVQYQSLLEANPYIDKLQLLGDSWSEFINILKQERYDYVIDLHHNLRTLRLKRSLGVRSYSFRKLNWEKWLMVNLKINKLPNIHIVDRYMETVLPLGVKMDALGLDYFIPEKDVVPVGWLPEPFRASYVVYAIGAQHETKKLPLRRMIELCDRINRPVVLLGGQEDRENGEAIAAFFDRSSDGAEVTLKELNKRTRIFNACGKFNINQSASLVKGADFVFSHDTGLMHIAAAFKKEVFSIWGNTIPDFGMYPFRTRFTVLENSRLGCRPCSKIGFKKCPKGHFRCMNDQNLDFYLPYKG